tara:strand:+ start:1231 stop:1578 length:348 start_codon:yes stop_codon:yes gene_type:complete
MKLTKQRLKEIIKEELGESLNPEWAQADKILSALVLLAETLETSADAEPVKLANAVVQKLRSAVDAMETRLNEKFAAAEDEVSDEEALVLKGPQFDPLGDSLPARRQRASVRRGK